MFHNLFTKNTADITSDKNVAPNSAIRYDTCKERLTMRDTRILRTVNGPPLFYSGVLTFHMLLGPVDVNFLHSAVGHRQHYTIL
jgi:hypothetical protein